MGEGPTFGRGRVGRKDFVMGSDDEFGPDTETIRAWLSQRATYAKDARVIGSPRGATIAAEARLEEATAGPSEPPRLDRADIGSIDNVDVGRSILDVLHDAPGDAPARTVPGTRDSAPSAPGVVQGRWTAPPDDTAARSTDVDFGERSGVRRAMSLVLLATLAGTGVATYLAVQEPTTATVGIAGTLGFLTVVVWAVRAGCTTTRMSLQRGKLSIERGGITDVVDVGNPYTPVAMIGEPGHRRWTVLLERPGRPLIVITRAMVDPERFTEALCRLRPELRAPAGGDDVLSAAS